MSVLIKNPTTVVSGGIKIQKLSSGTTVPNSGVVNNVYFNKNLSEEQVIEILQNANITSLDYPVLVTVANSGIIIMHWTEDIDGWGILYQANQEPQNVLWCDENLFSLLSNLPNLNLTHPGWQEFDNPIEINAEVLSEDGAGTQNELLKDIISITEYGISVKEIKGVFDGESIETNSNLIDMAALIDEKKIPLSIKAPDVLIEVFNGTAIPNTGYIERVYLNTDLNEEKVEALLSQLTYNGNGEYLVVATNINGLVCLGMNGMYAIADQNVNILWCNEAAFNQMGSQFGVTHSGWQGITNTVIITAEVSEVGTQNDLLTNLFSITPFEKITNILSGTYDGSPISVNENVDMQSLINEGKIPLSIEVPSGGLEINGLIKEYQVLAGENVNAGDFVEYINNVYKALNSTSYSSYWTPSCILLENNKVFIAHAYNSVYYLYGTIVEINGTTMTATTTQLSSTYNSCNRAPSCILLEQNKVFIAHSYTGDMYLYGTIVEINGTTITPTTTQLSSTRNSCYKDPSCILLEQNKVFIAHSSYENSNRYFYGTIVEINGTTITPTTTQLSLQTGMCYNSPSCILLEQNKVFIAHGYSSSLYLYGTIVEINGTTMTATTNELRRIRNSDGNWACILLKNNKVLIIYATSGVPYGTIVEIDGTTMTATTTQLSDVKSTRFCGFLLEPNKVFIAHDYTNEGYLYGTIVEIDGTTITPTTNELNLETNSSCNGPSCILLEQNKVFIAHSYGSNRYLGGTIYFGSKVKPYEKTISGVAKQSGVGGDTIQVYVPNEE